jgi:hypothetical protein
MRCAIEKKTDGFLVHCSGACGPYIITQIALDNLKNIHGRKQTTINYVAQKRQQDKNGCIRISDENVSFVKEGEL